MTAPTPPLAATPRRTSRDPQRYALEAENRRRARALEQVLALPDLDQAPPPPTLQDIPARNGRMPLLSLQALTLAHRVYYGESGSLTDAARAIIAAGLSDTDSLTRVTDRLRTWWARQRWPTRPARASVTLRDIAHDGGLIRSPRTCQQRTTGNGRAPAGKICGQNALKDSDFCHHHDPRPQYVARRAEHARRLAAARTGDLIDLGPFRAWCQQRRLELLAQADSPHRNDRGWGRLAAELGTSTTVLLRVMHGTHNRDPAKRDLIRARTLRAYLTDTPVSFHDLYGPDTPTSPGASASAPCPGCGAPKDRTATRCLACHRAQQQQCTHVDHRGLRCPTRTADPSARCAQHRRPLGPRRPRPGRPSALTDEVLLHALTLMRPGQSWRHTAEILWTRNPADVRTAYRDPKALAQAITRKVRALTGEDPDRIEQLRDQLTHTLGQPVLPEPSPDAQNPISQFVPAGPLRAALAARPDLTHAHLSRSTGISVDVLSRIHGSQRRRAHRVHRRTATRLLEALQIPWSTAYPDLLP